MGTSGWNMVGRYVVVTRRLLDLAKKIAVCLGTLYAMIGFLAIFS